MKRITLLVLIAAVIVGGAAVEVGAAAPDVPPTYRAVVVEASELGPCIRCTHPVLGNGR